MDTKVFLSTLTRDPDILGRAAYLLYAKRELIEGVATVTCAYKTEPKLHVQRFVTEVHGDIWWKEFVKIMTGMCNPACIPCSSNALFQPFYLQRLLRHANEQAHYVILDFGNQRNLWLGHKTKEAQQLLYMRLYNALGPYFE